MSERVSRILVEDMLESIDDIFEFIKGQTFDEFVLDKKTRSAVLRMLEVLGEAANRLPKELRDTYPEIEWGRIIRSRNLIIHNYEIIDYAVIWRIITIHIIQLKVSLEKIIQHI